ncbi:MAG: hypothetical protein WD200_00950 [Candidatus Andersenbacteria bacterium]
MSRRVIIILLGILILGVIGGTIYLVVQRLSDPGESTIATPGSGSLQESGSGSQQIVDPTGDDDNDGLTNADEALWGTARTNPDTDGDGFLDGDEVAANHNPTIAGPNDILPPDFQLGKDINPIEGTPDEPLAVAQFFVNNLDLSGPKENVTEAYQRAYPPDQRTPETLKQYVNEQPIVTQLPAATSNALRLVNTPLQQTTYLSTADETVSFFSNQPLFQSVINDLFGKNNTSSVEGLALMARIQQEALITTAVPPEAENLHRLLLGYTELLAATFDQMAQYNTDRVRAVLAIRQWEQADARYIPLINQEFDRLNTR